MELRNIILFFEDITKAVSEMSDDVSVVSIPNSFGLFLVADNSKELEERKEDHSVMYPKTIDGKNTLFAEDNHAPNNLRRQRYTYIQQTIRTDGSW